MYNNRVSATPTPRSRGRPIPSTPRTASRPKKPRGVSVGGEEEEEEEMSKFRELYPQAAEEEEAIFKKPKPKVSL